METHEGKSVPVVKEFQIEGSWAPVTPIKPILTRLQPIYQDGQSYIMREQEGYLSRFSQQNQPQTLLSCSISSAEKSIPSNNYNSYHNNLHNNFWDAGINLQRENVETQRRGLEGYSPNWSIQGRRTMPSSSGSTNLATSSNYPMFSSWVDNSLAMKNNGVTEIPSSMLENNNYNNSSDPLYQFNGLSFGDLLASTSSIFPGWNCQPDDGRYGSSSTFRRELNQQNNAVCGQEMQGTYPHQYWTSSNMNTTTTKHASGSISTFAPPTPDLQRKQENTAATGNTNQMLNEQNGLHEHEAAAAIVNLQGLNHNKEVMGPTADSSCSKAAMPLEENHNLDKGGEIGIDLNKTPQKKQRRKRYTPKVVNENKPKRTPKPKTPKNTESKEIPRTKRKYVRKNTDTASTSNPAAGDTEATDPLKPAEPAAKSCRKSLNFDLNGLGTESNDSHTAEKGSGEEPMVRSSKVGIAYDLNRAVNQELKDYISLPAKDKVPNTQGREMAARSLLEQNAQSPNSSPCASSNEEVQTRGSKREHCSLTDATEFDARNVTANHCTVWQPNNLSLGNESIQGLSRSLFPEIVKRKRTEKGQRTHTSSTSSSDISQAASTQTHPRVNNPTASKYYYCHPAPFGATEVTNNQKEVLMRSAQNRVQLQNTWVDISRPNKKKRTQYPTRVRDMATLKGIASVSPAKPAAKSPRRRKNDVLNGVHSCMEALTEDAQATPKSKRRYRKQNSGVNSRSSKGNQHWDIVLYDSNHSRRKRKGSIPGMQLIRDISIEAIIEGLEQLDLNREGRKTSRLEHNALVPYCVNNAEQNALVPYQNAGTIVPFDPVRKRRQRAKVDLDDETTRVWRLLLENIDNAGIDGTDEEKAKWWENERCVFGGRVDSFIARMRLVQGDRRFTPWKGSVLDSVIGVFLTQNVSDHLSSSAFMSLAARFPVKSESSGSTLSEEATSALVVEPEICIIEPEESIAWNDKSLDQPLSDRTSRIIHDIHHREEKEVINSEDMIRGPCGSVSPAYYSSESSKKAPSAMRVNKDNTHTTETEEASILGYDRARDDVTSSQQSVISYQNSVNSPNLQTGGIKSTFLESNSKAQDPANSSQYNYFGCSTSFMGLLKLAESPLLHEPYSQILGYDQPECIKHVSKDLPEVAAISSSDSRSHLIADLNLQATANIELLEVESRSPNTTRKDDNSTTEDSNLTTESTMQHLEKERSSDGIPRASVENVCSCYVLEGEEMVIQSQRQSRKEAPENTASSLIEQTSSTRRSPNLPNSSQEAADVTESTTALERTNNDQREVEQLSKHNHIPEAISDIANANSSKTKRSKSGKDKRHAFDWDSLRRQAQVNGRDRKTTPNTRNSIDWEAVRHADVRDIADTIKERGMNNMLAERIKDLLDRLVEEHGSIDMEWLRDIPPDKAKEYLLSFRGLGLKSVECVRLLTLHHLAFPVDTNVGRIAVRLGWVPLQPLPESLQLHLLEMYPILESIQKYLWPRLCKLDQKTLYELHYHMITFGKVFCTKRQPNCNACPLRGECRHFASAFASARLALPGPEERSIVASGGGSTTHPGPQANIDPLPLPSSWSNHPLETNYACIKDAPTQLSLPSPLTIHHLERESKVNNCEPIVEVPASPEPEQEQILCDIEDTFYDDPDEIPTIKLNMKEFSQTLQNFMHASTELQEAEMSRALVALTPDAASIPTPKLKNISRLRTEHHVYELPDTHPLIQGLDKREPDDPCSYLLAIWTPGETANSIQPPERRCSAEDPSMLCYEETCSYCSSQREADSQTVRGTLLIPCRTAMRGSFPLNGTYFQVNEVFADHDSSLKPIDVPRTWLWNLPRRTVYFGTSVPTIFRGLTTEEIQHCFWRGFVCVRGFDQKTRAPRPLMARLHFPASKMQRGAKGRPNDE